MAVKYPTTFFFSLSSSFPLLGHLGGPEIRDFGGLDGAEDEPKRREAGALGTGRGGGGDGGDGSKELEARVELIGVGEGGAQAS